MSLTMLCLAMVGRQLNSATLDPSQGNLPRLISEQWTPPRTSITQAYVNAAQSFLGNGLADPRSGTFSRVQIKIGDAAWMRPLAMAGFGWVLPGGKRVVMVDGIEYPVETNLGPADLNQFIAGNSSTRIRSMLPFNIDSASIATPALLLIVDRADLAERTYKSSLGSNAENPAFQLCTWLHQRYEMQVAEALIDHKDNEGLMWAKQMLKVSLVSDREKLASKFPEFTPMTSNLVETNAIYADLINRVQHPKPAKVDLEGVKKLDAKRRVHFYLSYLDEICGRQMGQPGGMDYNEDPLYRMMVSEGTIMVPGLIDALEHDNRLTRSVSFFRNFGPQRRIHPVRSVVRSLLSQIWPSSSRWTSDNSATMAMALRKAWTSDKRLSESERWAKVLADDHSDAKTWVQAAEYLVSPSDEIRFSEFSYQPSRNPNAPMKGESLRRTQGDEIARNISIRALTTVQGTVRNSADIMSSLYALRLGHCLAVWAPRAHTKVLAEITRRSWQPSGPYAGYFSQLCTGYALLCADRLLQGDRTALQDYVPCLKFLDTTSWVPVGAFRPFWVLPNDREVQAEATKYWSSQSLRLNSANPLEAQRESSFLVERAMLSPLLANRSFREMMAKGIRNNAVLGDAWAGGSNQSETVLYKFEGGASGGMGLDHLHTEQPKGKHFKVSAGDYFAQVVGRIKGAPQVCMIWPAAKLNAAKHALAEWLLDNSRDWLAVAKSSTFYSESF